MAENKAVKLANSGFRSLLGIEPTKNTDPSDHPANINFLQRYTPSELNALLMREYVQPEVKRADFTAAGIISYLKPTHKSVGEKRLQIDKMRALAPEIEQSKILVSASILSPNDLQEGVFKFSFDNIPALESDPDLAKEIEEVYDKHFNDTLELGIKSYDWIGDIQYSSGSKPILILPSATLKALKDRTTKDIVKDRTDMMPGITIPGIASFNDYCNALSDDYMISNHQYTWSDLFNDVMGTEDKAAKTAINLMASMESIGITQESMQQELESHRERHLEDMNANVNLQAGMADILVNLKKVISEGDVIRVSENPEILKFNTVHKLANKQEVYKKLSNKYLRDHYPNEEYVFLESHPEGYKQMGHPTLIVLPSESVIPIFVPGAPDQHLGYFILIDQHGHPLTIENSGMANNGQNATQCKPGDVSAAYEVMFGTNCKNSYFGNQTQTLSSASSMVFNYLLDKYIKTRLTGIYNRDDLEIARFDSIATVMFYRLLERKRTTLVYVDPILLKYFCFGYREDGTGSSKVEEIQFLLSLRTTLMMAQVLAMVNDAVEHKKVELGVDDKLANLEGLMDLVANIFIEKNKLTGSIDPSEIMRDMYSNALTIVPKNVPGLQDLSVDVTNSGGNSTRPDDQLLEQLTNLLVSHLDVPPSALNAMSEPEFARSLVTYNLFFAKKIARYQRIYLSHIKSLIVSYTLFDPIFQTAIMKKLQSAGKRQVREDMPSKTEELKKKNINEYSRSNRNLLMEILENVEVQLPKPDIVVDRTQFEEIRQHLSNIQEMGDIIFPQELIPSDDMEAQNALTVMKALWKRNETLRLTNEIGSFKMVDIPNLDDMDTDELMAFIQTMQNLASRLKKQRENISAPAESGGFGESGFGDELNSSGMDTDADMGMGGGEMSDMGDMGELGGGDELGESLDNLGGEETGENTNMNITEARNETAQEEQAFSTMYARILKPKRR